MCLLVCLSWFFYCICTSNLAIRCLDISIPLLSGAGIWRSSDWLMGLKLWIWVWLWIGLCFKFMLLHAEPLCCSSSGVTNLISKYLERRRLRLAVGIDCAGNFYMTRWLFDIFCFKINQSLLICPHSWWRRKRKTVNTFWGPLGFDIKTRHFRCICSYYISITFRLNYLSCLWDLTVN